MVSNMAPKEADHVRPYMYVFMNPKQTEETNYSAEPMQNLVS